MSEGLGISMGDLLREEAPQPEAAQAAQAGSPTPPIQAPPKDAATEEEAIRQDQADPENPYKKPLYAGVGDIVRGVASGAENAVAGYRQTAKSVASASGLSSALGDEEATQAPLEKGIEPPKSILGQASEEITRSLIGLFGVKKVFEAGAGKVFGSNLASAGFSAVGSGLTSDPNAQRISNAIAENPYLEPVFGLLAQDPHDAVLVSKAKAMVEDMAVSATATALFKGVHAFALWAKGDAKAAAKTAQEAIEASQKASASAESSVNGSLRNGTDPAKALAEGHVEKIAQNAEYSNPFMPTKDARDIDLQMAMPNQRYTGKQVIPFSKIKNGHDMTSEAAQKSIGKYQRLHMEGKAGEIQRQIAVKNVDGTFTVVSGNGRQGAHASQGFDAAEFHVFEQAGRESGQAAIGQRVTRLFSADGDQMIPMKPKVVEEIKKIWDEVATDAGQRVEQGTLPHEYPAGHTRGSVNIQNVEAAPNRAGATFDAYAKIGKIAEREGGKIFKTQTHDETHRLAEVLAIGEPEQLSGQLKVLRGALEDAPQVAHGARIVSLNLKQDAFEATRKALISGDDEAWRMAQAAQIADAQMQAELSAVASGGGRLLNIFGSKAEAIDPEAIGKIFADKSLRETWAKHVVATNGDPEKLAMLVKYASMGWGHKALLAHNEYWMGLGLLSRAVTQTANVSATAMNVMMQPATMISGGLYQGLRHGNWAQVRMGVGIYNQMRTNLFDSFELAWRAAKTGESILSPASTLENKMKFISAQAWGLDASKSGLGGFLDIMGELTRLSFRGLAAGDEFFKQLQYRGYVSAKASMEAADLVKKGTLLPKDIPGHVAQQLQASLVQQSDELLKSGKKVGQALDQDALKFAEKGAFVDDLKTATHFGAPSAGEMMASLAGHPLMRGTLLPFVKTPSLVNRTLIEYTPIINLTQKRVTEALKAGGEEQAMAIGKLTIGAGFYMGAAMLALEGRITGAPPAPGTLTEPGYKPYSIVFYNEDGTKKFVPYQRIQPFASILGLTHDFMQVTGQLDVEKSQGLANAMVLAFYKLFESDSYSKIGPGSVVAASNSLISTSFMRSMAEFFGMFGGYNSEAKAERFWQNKVASYVPGALAQFNDDEAFREVRTVLDSIKAKIPGLSQTLPPRRNYVGEIKEVPLGLPFSLITPSQISNAKDDPMMAELARLSSSMGEVKFSGPDRNTFFQGRKWDLTKDLVKEVDGKQVAAYDRMQELIGTIQIQTPYGKKNFREALDAAMRSPAYKLGEDNPVLDGTPAFPGQRTRLIKTEEERFRAAALEAVLNEYRSELGIQTAPIKSYKAEDKTNRKLSSYGQKLMDFAK